MIATLKDKCFMQYHHTKSNSKGHHNQVISRQKGLSESRLGKKLVRRSFLQTALITSTLPALEIFTPKHAYANTSSQNFLVFYTPNGRFPRWWVPSLEQGGLVFPNESVALQPFANKALSIKNASNNGPLSSPGAAHAMGAASILSSVYFPDLKGLKGNISVDQAIANHIGTDHRYRSLQWAPAEQSPCDVGGSPCQYTQTISWQGTGLPLLPIVTPQTAYNQIFGSDIDGLTGTQGNQRKQSILHMLDYLTLSGVRFDRLLGQEDKQRFEQFIDGVHDIEQRLVTESINCTTINAPTSDNSMPYQDKVDFFLDLIPIALSCGQTKVITYMMDYELSGREHLFLNSTGTHHGLSHNLSADGRAQLQKIETWYSEKLGQLLTKLEQTQGLQGNSLLDETLVMALACFGSGHNHDHKHNNPLFIGGNGTIKTNNRQIDLEERTFADINVSLLDAFGVNKSYGTNNNRFGDDGSMAIDSLFS